MDPPPPPNPAQRRSPPASGSPVLCPQPSPPAKTAAGDTPKSCEELREKPAKRRGVAFGDVQVYTHRPAISGDRVPSEGPGVGLGELTSVSVRRMTSFDAEREAAREGVQRIPPDERRRTLLGIGRTNSIDAAIADVEVVKRQRFESALDDVATLAPAELQALMDPPSLPGAEGPPSPEGPGLHDLFC